MGGVETEVAGPAPIDDVVGRQWRPMPVLVGKWQVEVVFI